MSVTSKKLSIKDSQQAIRAAANDVNDTLSVDGFLVGKVGHKVVMTIATTSIANDTEIYDFSDSGTSLYQITVIYTDGTRSTFLSAERTA